MTATSTDYSASPDEAKNCGESRNRALDTVPAGVTVQVQSVAGEDAITERLAASGLWPGAVLERIASAPFGDPILFRVHGYRLALRRSEAERVQVLDVDSSYVEGNVAVGGTH